jgi:hypothetical protein
MRPRRSISSLVYHIYYAKSKQNLIVRIKEIMAESGFVFMVFRLNSDCFQTKFQTKFTKDFYFGYIQAKTPG